MLVLTRKPGERILVGDEIVITVLESRGDNVRIGIEAPRGIKIQREEVVRAVTEANVEASRTSTPDAEARLRAALGALGRIAPAADADAAPATAVEVDDESDDAPRD